MNLCIKGITCTNIHFIEVNVRHINIVEATIVTIKVIYTCYANLKNHISVGHGVCSHLKYSSERSFWQPQSNWPWDSLY